MFGCSLFSMLKIVSLRREFNRGHGFAECTRPCVKVLQAVLLQRPVLEITLHRVHLGHAVADWRTRCKHNAFSAGHFVEVSTLHIEVGTLLRLILRDTGDVSHLCVKEGVFVVVRFVDKQPIDAEFLKCDHVILAALIVQLFELRFQPALRFLKLFDRKPFGIVIFGFLNALNDFVNLRLQYPLLPFDRDRDLLELRMPDDDRIIVTGGDAGAELLPVLRFKVAFGCDKDIRAGV